MTSVGDEWIGSEQQLIRNVLQAGKSELNRLLVSQKTSAHGLTFNDIVARVDETTGYSIRGRWCRLSSWQR